MADPPSDTKLQAMAEEHIFYEIERLVMVPLIQSEVAIWAHPIITQSLLEAFLVHLRALADFVTKPEKARHKTDAAAEHYFGGTWANQPDAVFGGDRAEHRACIDELHRRLAHISTQRLEDATYTWGPALMEWRTALINALYAFVTDLPDKQRSWFAQSQTLLEQVLGIDQQ